MESALASSSSTTTTTTTAAPRLIEYPDDPSGCNFLSYDGRQLLYLSSQEAGSMPFVVVLGFFSGKKKDVITKDLIEPVAQECRRQISELFAKLMPEEYSNAHIFFL
jgi:hypothetical protein